MWSLSYTYQLRAVRLLPAVRICALLGGLLGIWQLKLPFLYHKSQAGLGESLHSGPGVENFQMFSLPVWSTLAPGIPQWCEALGPLAVAVLMMLFYWERFYFIFYFFLPGSLSYVTLPCIASQITHLHSCSHPQFFLVSSLGCFFASFPVKC